MIDAYGRPILPLSKAQLTPFAFRTSFGRPAISYESKSLRPPSPVRVPVPPPHRIRRGPPRCYVVAAKQNSIYAPTMDAVVLREHAGPPAKPGIAPGGKLSKHRYTCHTRPGTAQSGPPGVREVHRSPRTVRAGDCSMGPSGRGRATRSARPCSSPQLSGGRMAHHGNLAASSGASELAVVAEAPLLEVTAWVHLIVGPQEVCGSDAGVSLSARITFSSEKCFATRVQACWRGWLVRHGNAPPSKVRREDAASSLIGRAWRQRGNVATREAVADRRVLERNALYFGRMREALRIESAIEIERWWRKMTVRRVTEAATEQRRREAATLLQREYRTHTTGEEVMMQPDARTRRALGSHAPCNQAVVAREGSGRSKVQRGVSSPRSFASRALQRSGTRKSSRELSKAVPHGPPAVDWAGGGVVNWSGIGSGAARGSFAQRPFVSGSGSRAARSLTHCVTGSEIVLQQ